VPGSLKRLFEKVIAKAVEGCSNSVVGPDKDPDRARSMEMFPDRVGALLLATTKVQSMLADPSLPVAIILKSLGPVSS
jgi:hypothetical protein